MLIDLNYMKILLKTILELNENPMRVFGACSTRVHTLQYKIIDIYVYIHTCTVGQKRTKHPYLFQYKVSYRNETGTNHHGL